MPLLFPTQSALCDVFAPQHPLTRPKAQPKQAPRSLFPAWSAVEDVKDKAGKLSEKAMEEYEKASHKAQEKTGKIELYSAKYYASCTFGGLIACVRLVVQ